MKRKIISITFTIFYFGIVVAYFLYITGWFNNPIINQGKDWTNFFEQKVIAMRPSKLRPLATTIPTPTPQIIGKPTQLVISKIGIDTQVIEVGLVPGTNTMDVPKDGFKAGWYKQEPYPGQEGSSVITAHYDTPTGAPALFYKLKNLIKGDEFFLVDEYGNKIDYVVKSVESLPVATFPKDLIYKDKGYSQLSLITCSGVWNPMQGEYSNRLVVIATLKNVSSFGELVAMNKQSEIQNMQPVDTQIMVTKGMQGLNFYSNKQDVEIYIQTSIENPAIAADIFLATATDFDPQNIEITDVFRSYIYENIMPGVWHIQLFQPQNFNSVDTQNTQIMLLRIPLNNNKEVKMLKEYPYESKVFESLTKSN